MNEHGPFLAAILADPGDPGPRRVFADWLDERGDPRGAWLRLAVEPPAPAGFVVERIPAIGQLERRPTGPALLRLFACWCARLTPTDAGSTAWDLLSHAGSRQAVMVAELFACGLTTEDHLAEARDQARHAAQAGSLGARTPRASHPRAGSAAAAAVYTTHPDPGSAAANAAAVGWAVGRDNGRLWQDRLLTALLTFEAPPPP